MANRIKIKRGLNKNIKTNQLVDGELAIATDTNKIYTNKGEVAPDNVYVGTSAPTDTNVDVWVNPNGKIDLSSLWDQLYPVGAIYMSVSSTNPGTLFGGTWTQVDGRFLYCTNTSKTTGGSSTTGASSGSTGGPSNNTSGSTTLTASQSGLPSHRHAIYLGAMYNSQTHSHSAGSWGDPVYLAEASNPTNFSGSMETTMAYTGGWNASEGHTHTLSSHTHSLNSHTHAQNLPPYFTVYCWYRVS